MPQIPQQLLTSLSALPQFDEKKFVAAHAEEHKITSVRLNPFKKTDLDFELNAPVLWHSQGFYVNERPFFTHDLLFHAGCYYVQEAGSMFIEQALKQTLDFSQTLKVLDLCAAPGGKSTLINSLLNEKSLLVANEFVKSRADVLAQNLSKWGTRNTVVTNNAPERFSTLNSFFDAIVVDAPCSGSGLFRKQPEAFEEWSEGNVKTCALRQHNILRDIIPALKENGILVYSTCSYSVEENENMVNWLIAEHQLEYVPLKIGANWGIVESERGYRFYPHLTQSEGFFCAVLRKKSFEENISLKRKNNLENASKAEMAMLSEFIQTTHEEFVIKKNNQFHWLNTLAAEFLNVFEKQFYFKKAGVTVGEIKGKDLVPNQELAWALNLNEKINSLNLDKETALKFLKKENFSAPENAKGLALIRYKNYGLGWVKILPNRINNYLPPELRVLK
ncbi:MAG: hypothetical protein KF900_03980 [Bacteroidetes bacterium]|nr:hypothetical protein [Bacteroidota bacterium]